jgi:hypothetical protein
MATTRNTKISPHSQPNSTYKTLGQPQRNPLDFNRNLREYKWNRSQERRQILPWNFYNLSSPSFLQKSLPLGSTLTRAPSLRDEWQRREWGKRKRTAVAERRGREEKERDEREERGQRCCFVGGRRGRGKEKRRREKGVRVREEKREKKRNVRERGVENVRVRGRGRKEKERKRKKRKREKKWDKCQILGGWEERMLSPPIQPCANTWQIEIPYIFKAPNFNKSLQNSHYIKSLSFNN